MASTDESPGVGSVAAESHSPLVTAGSSVHSVGGLVRMNCPVTLTMIRPSGRNASSPASAARPRSSACRTGCGATMPSRRCTPQMLPPHRPTPRGLGRRHPRQLGHGRDRRSRHLRLPGRPGREQSGAGRHAGSGVPRWLGGPIHGWGFHRQVPLGRRTRRPAHQSPPSRSTLDDVGGLQRHRIGGDHGVAHRAASCPGLPAC
jgi:hypothetical protein